MQKKDIILSEYHPSLLVDHFIKPSVYAPLVVSQDSILIDGYRRFQMVDLQDIPAIRMDVDCIYSTAFDMNRNTRKWDDIDCFLWARWARSLDVADNRLRIRNYPEELSAAPRMLIQALVNRRLHLGQAIRILQAPSTTWPFFIETLTSAVRLNVNDTARFIDMTFDLANRWHTKNLSDILQKEPLRQILSNQPQDAQQTGEALLKAMRNLRYPLYQQKAEELSTAWRQVNLEKWQAKKNLFLERGILEITIRARSQDEMAKQVSELLKCLSLPAWDQIWKHES